MRVGVLGGGQLGRMLALAGHPLGVRCAFLDPAPDAPMAAAAEAIVAPFDDAHAIDDLASRIDVATFEFENVSLASAERLAGRVPFFPGVAALRAKQDRLDEKRFFERLGIPTARFEPASTREELDGALAAIGFPAVVKTRRHGYDGKGQAVLRDARHVARVWEALRGAPLIVEAFVPFARELSVIAVRGRDGATAAYPLFENHHAGGILRHSRSPAPGAAERLQATAESIARRVLDDLDYVGVLAIELFEVDGKLLANEMAPRVHNSGHGTIEGNVTSQFENHLRAILGWPLGSTAPRGTAVMVNVLGALPDLQRVLAVRGARVHRYGKEPRPGRKLGHVTICQDGDGTAGFEDRVRQLLSLVEEHLVPLPPPGGQAGLPFGP